MRRFIGWTTLVLLFDQISKFFIQQKMKLNESLPIIKGVFHITYIENSRTAFGLFKYQIIFFIIAAFVSIFLVIFIYKKIVQKNSYLFIPLVLISGGAMGNFIDRLRMGGLVIDFLDFRIWPIFNFADTSIVCGMLIFLIHFLFHSKEEDKEEDKE
jgi:signal peptidase II